MNHIYALAFAVLFITGGISAGYKPVETKEIYDRLPETVYVPWPEKNTARLPGYCNG